jgi:hypothetical protein
MARQPVTRRVEHGLQLLAPGTVGLRQRLVGHRRVDRRVQQLALAAEVAVERHRADAELGGETAHAERVEAVGVEEVERGARNRLACEAARGGGALSRHGGCSLCVQAHGRTVYGTMYEAMRRRR